MQFIVVCLSKTITVSPRSLEIASYLLPSNLPTLLDIIPKLLLGSSSETLIFLPYTCHLALIFMPGFPHEALRFLVFLVAGLQSMHMHLTDAAETMPPYSCLLIQRRQDQKAQSKQDKAVSRKERKAKKEKLYLLTYVFVFGG